MGQSDRRTGSGSAHHASCRGDSAEVTSLALAGFTRYALAMSRMPVWFCIVCLPAWTQNANAPDLEAQATALKLPVEKAPKSALERTQIKLQAPAAGWEIGYPSAVTMDNAGSIYVLQRGEKADPLLVLNRDGKVVRSWGKGLYKIPHSIRIDPQGNIWTVDSGSSMVLKFSPQGEKLMEISVGE
jgi:streptogramin lyase